MAISMLHLTDFFQGEDNSLERGENHYKSGHVESFSYVDGESSPQGQDCLVCPCLVAGRVMSHTCSLSNCTTNGHTLDMKKYNLNPETSYV